MAFNPTTCSAALKAAILANDPTHATDNASLQGLCDAIATVMLAHIAANGVVVGTATGAMGGGPGVPTVGTIS